MSPVWGGGGGGGEERRRGEGGGRGEEKGGGKGWGASGCVVECSTSTATTNAAATALLQCSTVSFHCVVKCSTSTATTNAAASATVTASPRDSVLGNGPCRDTLQQLPTLLLQNRYRSSAARRPQALRRRMKCQCHFAAKEHDCSSATVVQIAECRRATAS